MRAAPTLGLSTRARARGEQLPPSVKPVRDAETEAALRILTAALAEQTL